MSSVSGVSSESASLSSQLSSIAERLGQSLARLAQGGVGLPKPREALFKRSGEPLLRVSCYWTLPDPLMQAILNQIGSST